MQLLHRQVPEDWREISLHGRDNDGFQQTALTNISCTDLNKTEILNVHLLSSVPIKQSLGRAFATG